MSEYIIPPCVLYNRFCVLPILLRHSNFYRFIYYREHKEKIKENKNDNDNINNNNENKKTLKNKKIKSSTLFVTNLHYDCTVDEIKDIFNPFGEVIQIQFGSMKTEQPVSSHFRFFEGMQTTESLFPPSTSTISQFASGGFVYVHFSEPQAVQRALKAATSYFNHPEDLKQLVSFKEKGVMRGIDKISKGEKKLDIKKLELETDAAMKTFDKEKKQVEKKKNKERVKPDADGFIVVTENAKKTSDKTNEFVVKSASKLSAKRAAKIVQQKEKTLEPDFYKFEKFKNRLKSFEEMRGQFEKDKKRISELRSARKFKPY
eukprot:TRINITY_DN383_c3_g1_i1.p1 TRINITY_DN383_c3_g1~~TRINITY_DN383_c3_g1_i1.p1  ORF type:complete len:317 (-),score=120.32 TRINITY_DN383_c3_g1_i1:45-995(-)